MCQVRELGQRCCYTEGSATSPKVLISRLVGEAGNCHVENADLGTHTETTIPPPPPPRPPPPALGTDRRRMQGNKQGVTESLEEEETGGEPEKRGGGKKERGSFQGKKIEGWGVGGGGQTVKARASSPELSVGSPASGYHAV